MDWPGSRFFRGGAASWVSWDYFGIIYCPVIEECRWFTPQQCRAWVVPSAPENQSHLSPHSLFRRLLLLHLLQPFLHQHDLLFLGEFGKKELNLEPHAPWRSTCRMHCVA